MRLILLPLLFLARLSTAASPVTVEFNPPPPFGYGVGSLIRHQAEIFVASPRWLDTAQLPTLGPVNDWLEIRAFKHEAHPENGGIRHHIQIDYQIFPSLAQATILEIPPLSLTALAPDGTQQAFALPAWSFTATPLIPPQWSDAQVKIRPLWRPKEIDLTLHWHRLIEISMALLLTALALFWRRGYFRQRKLPFARSLPVIRHAAERGEAEAALRAFHQALNETAGQALFAPQLADFLNRRPEFLPIQQDLQKFFSQSQHFFYNPQPTAPQWLAKLERLCRACARAERRCRK
ncbi:MAG: hypothetical protein N3A55_10910 [Methylohalobius sp.]|nr:hypothetical protein [Methylohalobius sp.]